MTETLKNLSYKIGTIFYILWGVLHIYAGYLGYQLATEEAPSLAQGKLYQGAWNLTLLAIIAIIIAVKHNWRNSLKGYWMNLFVVSVTDIGFVVLILIPGYATELLGPILWILGVIFTTIGILVAPRTR